MEKLSPRVRASFELLGAAPGAGSEELKKAYRRMALVYHPDRNPSPTATVEFAQITEAYELLIDSAQVAAVNRKYQKERLEKPVIEGLNITFGSFFGYRVFHSSETESFGILKLTSRRQPADQDQPSSHFFESDQSVLDNSAYDAIEVVYAGRFQPEDEEQLLGKIPGQSLTGLPWVILNNQGLLHFFAGDLRKAKQSYQELCERIPNNILFIYRLGICLILEGFKNPRRTLIGRLQPDRIKISKGLALLQQCLKLGEERSVGRQKCLVIRKVMADVSTKLGQRRQARLIWQKILTEDPNCLEAALKTNNKSAAKSLIRAKLRTKQQSPSHKNKKLLTNRS
jgi:tetratricopeptide (TPR) repeat protein